MFIHAELARRLRGAAMLDVIVGVLGEGDASAAQGLRGRRLADMKGLLRYGAMLP
jgi:hypothetical protein